MTAEDYLSGQVLLIDKPLHWTSFQAVNKLRWEITSRFQHQENKGRSCWHLRPSCNWFIGNLHWKNDQANRHISRSR